MTMPFIFNTLAYANKLVETGIPSKPKHMPRLAALSEAQSRPVSGHPQDLIARIEAAPE
jgi:hypothetical protein